MNSNTTIPADGLSTAVVNRYSTDQVPFLKFIGINKQWVWIALIGGLVQFFLFKLSYPFPDFFSDSYSYLFAANENLGVSIWPIGYSRFLHSFHAISFSDTTLIAFQYFFLELTALYFFFTILYFFNPGINTKNVLMLFLFYNPLFLYLSNYVNSDPLFVALSIIWITQLIWMICSPMMYQVFTHAIILFLCFTIRNNAYYYPVISIVAILLSNHRRFIKFFGIVIPLIMIGIFIQKTREAAYQLTGTKMYSLFTGWQLANNALYMYQYIDVNPADLPSAASRELDSLSKDFYKKAPPDFQSRLDDYVGNFFIRQPEAPLKKYIVAHYRDTSRLGSVINWGQGSVDFAEYGTYLIRHNPWPYVRHFMLLNTKNYFFPPLEKLEIYNLGRNTVAPVAAKWFHYPGTTVKSISPTLQGIILKLFPTICMLANVGFLLLLAWFLLKKKYKTVSRQYNKTLLIITIFQLANFGFSVFATIIVLRYQVFPMIVCVGTIAMMTRLLQPAAEKTGNTVTTAIPEAEAVTAAYVTEKTTLNS